MNPLAHPIVRILAGAMISTYVTPRVLVKVAPKLGGVINPKTGRFALPAESTPDQIKVATQAVIGTSAAVTALTFVLLGMATGKSAAAAASTAEGAK